MLRSASRARSSSASFFQVSLRSRRERRVEQSRLQLDEAGHAGHHLARAAVVEQRAERDQRVAEGVVARERLHRRPRAAVGRAEHQEARAVARHHALPGVGLLERHRARDQAAHRVRERSAPAAGWWRARRARRRPPRRGDAPRLRSGGASRRRTGSPRACRRGARSGRRRGCRSGRRARRSPRSPGPRRAT